MSGSLQEKLNQAKLYCVSSAPKPGQNMLHAVEAAVQGGADIFQLRDKTSSVRELIALAEKMAAICHQSGALFFVNDRVDVALASGADGVHLGQDDLPLIEAKRIAKTWGLNSREFLIGCSTHSLVQAEKAVQDGADYLGCGPVFATPTKAGRAAVGLELVRAYREKIKIPFVAIGGIDSSNLKEVTQAGARCVAVVRAAFDAADVQVAVESLKRQMLETATGVFPS